MCLPVHKSNHTQSLWIHNAPQKLQIPRSFGWPGCCGEPVRKHDGILNFVETLLLVLKEVGWDTILKAYDVHLGTIWWSWIYLKTCKKSSITNHQRASNNSPSNPTAHVRLSKHGLEVMMFLHMRTLWWKFGSVLASKYINTCSVVPTVEDQHENHTL